MDIRKKVDALVRTYQTRNPFEMIKGMNVILVRCPLDGVRGFYQYFQRNNIIYIDESLTETEQMFVCAHEMGHMFLHKKSNAVYMDSRTYLNTNRFENEANLFAMELLISDEFLADHKQFTTEQISRMLGYHESLIKLRFAN